MTTYDPYSLEELSSVARLISSSQSSEISDDEISTHINRILNSSQFRTWQMTLAKGYRLRRLDEAGLQTDLSGLGGKPAPHEVYGRCNTRETSAFYASTDLETALMEQRAVEGEYFQVLETGPVGDKEFKTLPIGWLDHYRRFGNPPEIFMPLRQDMAKAVRKWVGEFETDEMTRLVLLDAFFSEEFKKVVRVDDNNQYRNTAFYSSALLEVGVEKIVYPSVQNYGGWNVAIRPDCVWDRLEVTSVKLIQVTRAFGYGLYEYTEVAAADVSGHDISWGQIGQL